jgi:U3 small nucleolar RNA-associated protein 21
MTFGLMSGSDAGSQTPEPITSLAMDGKAVWAASGTVVRKYLRGKEVCCPLDMEITRFHIE